MVNLDTSKGTGYVLLGIWNQNSYTIIYEKYCSNLFISIFTFSQSNSTRWFWSHSLISANYTNWHHTEPNGGLNDVYVLMASGSTYDYEWVDAKAVTKEYPICQFYP